MFGGVGGGLSREHGVYSRSRFPAVLNPIAVQLTQAIRSD